MCTKAKYLNQCITPRKKLREFDPAILKYKGQILRRAAVATINFFFPLHSIVVLNNEYGADVGRNSIPRVSSRHFSRQAFNLSIYTSRNRCYNLDLQRLYTCFIFQLLGPVYTKNQTKWQNELPIARKVVSRI